jgi:hypothetical protein
LVLRVEKGLPYSEESKRERKKNDCAQKKKSPVPEVAQGERGRVICALRVQEKGGGSCAMVSDVQEKTNGMNNKKRMNARKERVVETRTKKQKEWQQKKG